MTMDAIEWGAPVLPRGSDGELEAEARKAVGSAPGVLMHVVQVPWVARGVIVASRKLAAEAPADLLDVARFVTACESLCRYSYAVARANLRLHGMNDARIEAIERGAADEPPIAFARLLARGRPSKADIGALRATGMPRGAITELVFAVAMKSFKNRVATFLAVPPDSKDGAGSKNPLTRMFKNRTLPPTTKTAAPAEGDFAPLVQLLDATPCAQPLRQLLDGAIASTLIPRRAKGLMLAVCARALGDTTAEYEARSLFGRHEFGSAEVDRILANHGSPNLDELESRLVPYAHGSVKYQPIEIQQQTRALADAIGPERMLEAVGLAALGNALGRIGVLKEF
jgi:hypothetical protein